MVRKVGRASLLVAAFLAYSTAAWANVTGNIIGRVTEKESGNALAGVTVVASGPQGDEATVSNDDGTYEIRSLAVGTYVVRFYMGEVTVEQPNVVVSVDKTIRVNGGIPATVTKAEVITVVEKAPTVDIGSSRVGLTLNQEFVRNTPNALNLGGLLEKAPGAYSDPITPDLFYIPQSTGYSLSGGTGADNSYYLDGVNVTSVGYGVLGSDLMSPFIDEVEIISNGYSAEYGRALGGVINIITKSGTNDLKGSAFTYVSPGFASGKPRRVFNWASSATSIPEPEYATNLGVEVGGPIVKNKLFFWVGYAPELTRSHSVRYVDKFVDTDGDGVPDGQGSPTVENISRSNHDGSITNHQYAAKVSYQLAPEQKLSVGVYGIHRADEYLTRGNADPKAATARDTGRSNDVSLRWLAKFFDRKWQLEANVGVHSEGSGQNGAFEEGRNGNRIDWNGGASLGQFNSELASECAVNTTTMFDNCPALGYTSGGWGTAWDIAALRVGGQVKSSHTFRAAGWHQLKYGFEYELNKYDSDRWFTGPEGARALVQNLGGPGLVIGFFRLKPGERAYMRSDGEGFDLDFDDTDPDPNLDGRKSDLLKDGWLQDTLHAETETRNTATFIQDSWSILSLPLTLNAGFRWETQQVQDYQGGTPITLGRNFAPRVGLVYDVTNQGRSKLYTHWGRFYESIPMDLNNRAFGGEGIAAGVYIDPLCPTDKGPANWTGDGKSGWRACDVPPESAVLVANPGENLLVQKKLKGSYSDELVLGGQYELMEDFTVGAAYIKRWLGRAIEDVHGVVSNPGQIPQKVVDEAEEAAVAAEAAAAGSGATTADIAGAAEARFVADTLKEAADMPKAKRDYDAVQLSAAKRFSKNWMAMASYTYSRTKGNYPGLYAADKGQLDPNYTSLYDLTELMINRDGALPNDRPHVVRLDGYYQIAIGAHHITTGLGAVARSGRPNNYLGSHSAYGTGETFILPRGMAGRTPMVTRFDLHLGYRTKLTDGTSLDVYVDVFNLLNQRTALLEDQNYTLDPVDPIVGGDESDLVHLKSLATGGSAAKNPNYLSATAYQAPIAGRFGLRLSF